MREDRLRWPSLVGFGLLWVGIGGTAVLRLLQRVDPREWGGPDIGGGLLLVAAWACAVTGAVFLVVALALPVSRRSFAPGAWWTATVISAALVAGLFAVRLVPVSTASGVRGQVGVTVSSSGSLVVVVESCGSPVSEISVLGPNRGGTNAVFARYHATTPVTSTLLLDLGRLPSDWVAEPGRPGPTAGADDLRIIDVRGASSELRQVSFTGADLSGLDVISVLSSVSGTSRVRTSIDEFSVLACR